MTKKIERNDGESFLGYCQRLTTALNNKQITYEQWADGITGDVSYGDETLRRVSVMFTQFLERLSQESITDLTDQEIIDEINRQKDELRQERLKTQTINREFVQNEQIKARQDLLVEKIEAAVSRLKPIEIKHMPFTHDTNISGVLCLSDFHAGSTYEIKGMYNEIVSKYSYEELQNRMWRLLAMLEEDDNISQIDDLYISILGDCYEGVLRMSSLTQLKEPVLDTVVKFSDFLAEWIAECQRRLNIPVKVIICGSNHDKLRILGQKAELEGEDLGKITRHILYLRLKDCQDIEVKPFAEEIVETIRDNNILFYHGADKDLGEAIEYFSNLFNVDIDACFAGHFHENGLQPCGITETGDRRAHRCGSICGINPFSKKIRKASRPSALFTMYSKDGEGWSRNYYIG